MSKRRSVFSSKKRSRSHPSIELEEREDYICANLIPSCDDSNESDLEESDSESDVGESADSDIDIGDNSHFIAKSYDNIYDNYNSSQKKLEPDHVYEWLDGEFQCSRNFTNEFSLKETDKASIAKSSPTELFEYFFSLEVQNHIIDCTKESSGYEMSLEDLQVFVGIIIFSSYNMRLSQRDYWSKDPHLKADPVQNAMSRNKFEDIKSKLKFYHPHDVNNVDKIYRVRSMTNIFRQNLSRFGIFSSALSIDEMMLKFYGRSSLKQFIRGKPVRFGIKLWALCSSDGYLFDFEIYCGKDTQKNSKLSGCSLGSRVVINMLQVVFQKISLRNRDNLHVYCDNLFTSQDLFVHLKKYGLCATGTVRENRVTVKNNVQKKDERGKYDVKHDKASGLNFISVMDSKPVSILSTATGVTPLGTAERRQKGEKEKKSLDFPNAFLIYNKFMGGVDLHDQRCNKVEPIIRSKKWTWVIFVRIIQSSLTNATILFNKCNEDKKTFSTKDLAMSVAKVYLNRAKKQSISHILERKNYQRYCSTLNCKIRTKKYCKTCEKFFCEKCSSTQHL